MNPFRLPKGDAIFAKLSGGGLGHGARMAGMMKKPDVPVDNQQIWDGLQLSEGENSDFILYVHIPFCVARCVFCGFFKHPCDEEAMAKYTENLLTEIDAVGRSGRFRNRKVSCVYLGGGTPTSLSATQLRSIIERLHRYFAITDKTEFTVEGRLWGLDDERVRACLETGVNRFSFGIQSFETTLRRSLGRRMTHEELIRRLEEIKAICGDKIALVADLIYGLPGQDQRAWMEENVKIAHASALDGVDFYSLKMIPGTPLAKRVEKEGNWSEQERYARHREASDFMASAGWTQKSTTHWDRNGLDRNIYNTLAKRVTDMVPFGCGAGGFLGGYGIMQAGTVESYGRLVAAGKKPIGSIMKMPPQRGLSARFTSMTDLGFFDPKRIPETDFSPLFRNWTEAGVWTERPDGSYRLTRLGEYYQTKLNSMLIGYHMASHVGGWKGFMMKLMGVTR